MLNTMKEHFGLLETSDFLGIKEFGKKLGESVPNITVSRLKVYE